MLFQVVRQLMNGHPVHAGATLVTLDLLECLPEVLSVTYHLHQSFVFCRAFGLPLRHERFGPFCAGPWGCTPVFQHEGQVHLVFLPRVAHESQVAYRPLPIVRAFVRRSRRGLSVAAPFGIAVPH